MHLAIASRWLSLWGILTAVVSLYRQVCVVLTHTTHVDTTEWQKPLIGRSLYSSTLMRCFCCRWRVNVVQCQCGCVSVADRRHLQWLLRFQIFKVSKSIQRFRFWFNIYYLSWQYAEAGDHNQIAVFHSVQFWSSESPLCFATTVSFTFRLFSFSSVSIHLRCASPIIFYFHLLPHPLVARAACGSNLTDNARNTNPRIPRIFHFQYFAA